MLAASPPPSSWVAPIRPLRIERRYVDAAPFAVGGHRSVLLRVGAGAAIAAPCSGVVAFSGSVAASPPTLTLACSELRATLRWVRSPLVRGSAVHRGTPVGTASTSVVGLSARYAAGRYVDPLALLGSGGGQRTPPILARRRNRPRPSAAQPASARRAARALRPVHLPATAFASVAGSGSVSADGARSGRRHLAGAATELATPRPDPVDWPLTIGGVAAVLTALLGSLAVSLRRRLRHPGRPRRPGLAGLAHLVGLRQ